MRIAALVISLCLTMLGSLSICSSAAAWSGSVVPEGKLPNDPYALTVEKARAVGLIPKEGNGEEGGAGDAEEAYADMIYNKPVNYWLEYARQFSNMPQEEITSIMLQNRNNRVVLGLINGLIISGKLFNAPKMVSEKATTEDMEHDMVIYSTAVSAWIQVRHMKPNEFQAFLNTEACKPAFGEWYCKLMQKNGFNWDTPDGINYAYIINANASKEIKNAVKNAYFH
jgi:hypothetical protein